MKHLGRAIAAVDETYREPTTLEDHVLQAIRLHADGNGFLTDTTPEEVCKSVMEALREKAMSEFVDKERN